MTFTPETWVQVNRVKDQRYADAKIVGWYHTHPRFGIFLSDMDKFIHKHHFSQPWTTALVVDPVQETRVFLSGVMVSHRGTGILGGLGAAKPTSSCQAGGTGSSA